LVKSLGDVVWSGGNGVRDSLRLNGPLAVKTVSGVKTMDESIVRCFLDGRSTRTISLVLVV
jgi:hypothetical protein